MPGGDGTHRETTVDRLTFNDDGTMQKVVPTLTSVDPLTYDGVQPQALRPPKVQGKAVVGGRPHRDARDLGASGA